MKTNRPTALFLDVGGVLLTNGWDRSMRQRAAETFKLDYDEMDERHHLTFDTYEEGKLSLNEYLKRSLSISSLPRASSVFANRMPISIACFRCRSSLTERVVYIEDRFMFVEVAQSLGIRGIHHRDYDTTRTALTSLGLVSEA